MKWVASVTIFLMTSFTLDANAETLSDALKQCSKVDNSLKRLVCYDKLVQRANGLQNSDLPELRQQQRTRVADTKAESVEQNLTKEQAFGFEKDIQIQKEAEFDSIRAIALKIELNPYKRMTITLDNGQVWKEAEKGYAKIKEGDEVIVERGMMGSFYIKKADSKRRSRVKRSK